MYQLGTSPNEITLSAGNLESAKVEIKVGSRVNTFAFLTSLAFTSKISPYLSPNQPFFS